MAGQEDLPHEVPAVEGTFCDLPTVQEGVDDSTHRWSLPRRLPSQASCLGGSDEVNVQSTKEPEPRGLLSDGVWAHEVAERLRPSKKGDEARSDWLEKLQLEQALHASFGEATGTAPSDMGATAGDGTIDEELPGQQAAADMTYYSYGPPPWDLPTPHGGGASGGMPMLGTGPYDCADAWSRMASGRALPNYHAYLHGMDATPSHDEIELRHDDAKAREERCRELAAHCKDWAHKFRAEVERRMTNGQDAPKSLEAFSEPGPGLDPPPASAFSQQAESGANGSIAQQPSDIGLRGAPGTADLCGKLKASTEPQAARGAAPVAGGAEDQYAWKVPRSKFSLSDRSIVSPPFYVQELGEYVQYRAHVTATRGEGKKGGHSLKKAGGRGKLEVQRTKPPPGGEPSEQTVIAFEVGPEQRGPVTHNFAESPLCGLPRDYEEWDFLSHVDAFHYVNIVVKLPGRKVTDKAA